MKDATAFADRWAEGWNSQDLDRIMAHYADDIVFRSRKAVALTGAGEIRGKPALRAYWAAALSRQPDLHFTVDRVFAGHDMLTIAYTNHRDVPSAETLWFGADDLIVRAGACHAA